MQFPEVPSRPEQAYKLTAKGLELLAKLKEKGE
jgi:DNA-binding PadR family transcriptional regulator